LDDHNPDHVNPSGDDNGDVYVDCDNIIQVFMDVSIAAFWVVLSYNLVGVYLATFWEMCFNFRVNFEDGGGGGGYSFETSVSTCRTVRRYRPEDEKS